MTLRWRAYVTIGFFYIFCSSIYAQEQSVADSLRRVYLSGDLEDSLKYELLRNLSFNEVNDFNLALSYAQELIDLAKKNDNQPYLYVGYFQKGNKKKILGDLDEALDTYFKSVEIAKTIGNLQCEGSSYGAIADIFNASGNHTNAVIYHNKAISILREANDSIALASAILNAGDEYMNHQKYDSALLYFKESGIIFENVNYPIGKAYNLGNLGMVYANKGENELAEKNINEAIAILEKSQDYYPVCFYLLSISDIYAGKKQTQRALNYANRSLDLAQQYKLKQQISDANLKLAELYESAEKPVEAYKYYKSHILYRDSVNNIETIQNMADLRTEFEVNLREKEINLLEKSQILDRIYIIIAIILLLLSVVVLLFFRQRFLTAKLVSISERKQHDQKIKDLLSDQETKALQSMVEGRDNERKRLAQELHNHFGSLLATIKVNVNGIDEDAIPNHNTIMTLVDRACTDIRNMSHALNMGISENFGLVPALKELTSHLRESGGLEVEFSASMSDGHLDSENEIFIYRIVQELLSNALKHSGASKLGVMLTFFEDEKMINIMVQDNGRGFSTKKSSMNYHGMGIKSLEKMVNDKQGEIKFDSNPNSGTTVTIDLPVNTILN